jgi:hypothetical protein
MRRWWCKGEYSTAAHFAEEAKQQRANLLLDARLEHASYYKFHTWTICAEKQKQLL